MHLHSIHKRRIQFSRQRWRDGEGRYLKGATDMKTPDLFRPKGKKGIYYANTTYKGIKVSDCLHTNDELLANRMFQWDWKHAQEKSSVGWNVRVKDLRHFFGSTMLNRGVDSLEIANQMGHQDLNMLRERYGHYTDEKLHNSSKVWDYIEVNKSKLGANSKGW